MALGLGHLDVGDLRAERGIEASFEIIRHCSAKCEPQISTKIRRFRSLPADKWHLDEIVILILGKKHWRWHAVDSNGNTLETFVQSRRNAGTAKQFLRKFMKCWGTPRVIVQDRQAAQLWHRDTRLVP